MSAELRTSVSGGDRSVIIRAVFLVRKNEVRRPHVESHHILVNELRKFGRVCPVGHQAIDGFEKRGGSGEEFDPDQIKVAGR